MRTSGRLHIEDEVLYLNTQDGVMIVKSFGKPFPDPEITDADMADMISFLFLSQKDHRKMRYKRITDLRTVAESDGLFRARICDPWPSEGIVARGSLTEAKGKVYLKNGETTLLVTQFDQTDFNPCISDQIADIFISDYL